ncbi:MAG: flagellin [Paracoccaceae bacterium]
MTITSLGDMTQTLLLRRQQSALKSEMQTLSGELTTGIAQDTAAHLGGNVSALAGIETALTRIDAFRSATAQMTLLAQGMQTALDTIGTLATDLGPQLLTAASGSGEQSVDALGADARQRFATAVSALNARVGDKTIFAGVNSSGAAVAGAEDILAALSAATAGATTAADVEAAVSAWFDDPAGFSAIAYQGGAARPGVTVAPGETAQLSVTADDPAIREVLKGLAMAALLDTGVLAGDTAARADLAAAAGEKLAEAETGRAYLAARIGIVEAQVDTAATRNETETSALKVARSDLVSVDSYEASTRLDEAETQLNLLYALTARLGNLSLLEYL